MNLKTILLALVTLLPLSAATYGPPLIPRATPDGTTGAIVLSQQVIPQGETVVNFAWFNNSSVNRNWITPVVLQLVSGTIYKVVGVGESRQNAGTGIQKFPFNVLYGSALASGPNHVFGWWSGRVTLAGNQINLLQNPGVVVIDVAPSTPGYRESCPRPDTGPCGTFPTPLLPTITFANVYAGSATAGLASGNGRLYSVQFETTEIPIPVITSVLSLTGFGGAPKIAAGGWIEIFGSRFTTATKEWAATDFSSDFGPTLLDGVRVSIDGRPAFISYVSPGQINAVVPDGITIGRVNVVVTNSIGSSVAFPIETAARVPSLLATNQFKLGSKQYVVAQHPDQAFVGPENLIAGAAFRLAAPRDRLTIYGVAFGETIPAIPAGKIASGSARFPNVQVRFADIPAQVEYAGPVSGLVGLSQMNLVVPGGVPTGDVRLTVSVDGVANTQELWIALR
ncbi:MAG: hypothetical protein H7Y20_01460 [Bryobacteraceae bacterium]|nr:hypothetical protein [Bryobacteraceae bacterium]